MAMFDDRRFILSHIRHSFITCDDTGVCELAMLNEIMPHHLPNEPDQELLDSICLEIKSELEGAQSFDILSDMEMIGAHRRRSNTAQRLERLKKERKNQAKVKVIQWKDPCDKMTGSELDELFPPDESEKIRKKNVPKTSALSAQIDKFPALPNNPFNDYSRFDGRVSEVKSVKRMSIFLTMLPESEMGSSPLEVVVIASARVQDLIGLICWQYTNEGKEPRLKPSVNRYCLRISEENGDVDPDFPSLNPKEPVSKFGFPFLALVEKEDEGVNASLSVTVHVFEMFSKLDAPNLQVPLKWVLEQALKKRKISIHSDSQYRLEAVKEPGVALDLDLPLGEVNVRDFKVFRVGGNFDEIEGHRTGVDSRQQHYSDQSDHSPPPSSSRHKTSDANPSLPFLPDMFAIEAPLYKEFTVKAIHKLSKGVDVSLAVSGQKIDVNPFLGRTSHKPWSWQPKAASIPIENVAECLIVKANADRTTFKIFYKTANEFQSLKFEGNTKTVDEIVRKIKYVMKMRSGTIRDEYYALKERKMSRRFSHHSLSSFKH